MIHKVDYSFCHGEKTYVQGLAGIKWGPMQNFKVRSSRLSEIKQLNIKCNII